MKNKQRTSTKVIISYNDGSTYTFTNVQQFSLMPKYDEIEVTQIRNKEKLEPSPRFTLCGGIIKNHPAIRNIRVTRGL